jgi:shikimate kinase
MKTENTLSRPIRLRDADNVVLIGMPGVGKSTIGVLLAKAVSMLFVDVDVVIQSEQGRRLQDIIDAEGMEAFVAVEERHVLSLTCENTVIATGGSVVYSPAAMAHLQAMGIVVLLDLPLELLEQRAINIATRGIVRKPGQSLAHLYEERRALYAKYADTFVDCAGLDHAQVLQRVLELW